ncbi:UPF0157 protein, partial [Lachnellula suecica]
MANLNGVPISELLKHYTFDPNSFERISHRKTPPVLEIVDPDPTWPDSYDLFASRITTALGPSGTNSLLSVSHVGSTSVPSLPAKAIIDIDVVVHDVGDESSYVSALESQNFQFLLREKWHGHRFFVAEEPMSVHVHVWGPQCAEAERHRVFRDYLRGNAADREEYAR